MKANERSAIVRLRRQRDWAALAAIVVTAIGILLALPTALIKRKDLQSANQELISVQRSIVDIQSQIRDVQARIVGVQSQIRAQIDAHGR